jgi:hypothetical protein
LLKHFIKNKKFRGNEIDVEGARELAQGLKVLINLNSLTIDLE